MLPVLLIATDEDRFVERPDALKGPAADRHVRAPDERNVSIGRTTVKGRDRRWLAPAGVGAAALQEGPDRPTEHVVFGMRRRAVEHCRKPAGGRGDVVVDEHQQV